MFNRSLLKDINSLAEVDGYSAWREKEAYSLSDLVQRRLKYLQNPSDCNNAKKLICNLNKVSAAVYKLRDSLPRFRFIYSVDLFLKYLLTGLWIWLPITPRSILLYGGLRH